MSQDQPPFPRRSRTDGPEETMALAARFARVAGPGDVVFLRGNLGAGKTHFVRGFCRGLGMTNLFEVDSPTYTIINHYQVGPGVDHIDLYRLAGGDDLEEIGFEDLLEADTIKLIEWPERLVGYAMDPPAFVVTIHIEAGEGRTIDIIDKEGLA